LNQVFIDRSITLAPEGAGEERKTDR